ncbi:MAG: hypothetical protein M5U28_10740 [Sandaracinaceae bacterium]|nr:hypothetical protein [Sandaracinaceae bacterium]
MAVKRATIVSCVVLGGWACSADPRPIGGETDAPARVADHAIERRGGPDPAAGDGGAPETEARRRFGQLPMRYEENRGQHDARARYVGRQGR